MHDAPVVPLLLVISLILCAARLAGAAARKLGQPRVLGELLVGVALGPTVVDLLHWRPLAGGHLAGTIKELAELGVLILMFNIALEIQPRELMAVGRTALYAGVLGAAVPLGVIALLTWAFGFPTHVALLTGVVMSANSTSTRPRRSSSSASSGRRRATPCWPRPSWTTSWPSCSSRSRSR
jgi:Kef-type K+ transport system membrane component KefB